MIQKLLNHRELEKIKAAVAGAEKNTRAEIVPLIKTAASTYPAATWRVNIFAILIASMIYRFLPSWGGKSIEMLLVYQALALVISVLILRILPRIKLWFLSPAELEEEIDEAALTAFHKHKIHQTREQSGVLIAVFLTERRVKILADAGIHQKDQNAWPKIMEAMIDQIKKAGLAQGVILGITECGKTLEQHYPAGRNNPDELKNQLIIEN